MKSPSCIGGKDALLYHTQRHVMYGCGKSKAKPYMKRDPLTEKPTDGYLSALKILQEREKSHEQANLPDRHL